MTHKQPKRISRKAFNRGKKNKRKARNGAETDNEQYLGKTHTGRLAEYLRGRVGKRAD